MSIIHTLVFVTILLITLCFVCKIISKSMYKFNCELKLTLVQNQTDLKEMFNKGKDNILRYIQLISS